MVQAAVLASSTRIVPKEHCLGKVRARPFSRDLATTVKRHLLKENGTVGWS